MTMCEAEPKQSGAQTSVSRESEQVISGQNNNEFFQSQE